jgi:trk system potassium uptake protein
MEQSLPWLGFPRRIGDWFRSANYNASQFVPVAFAVLILLGTLLLMTPFATRGRAIGFIDALFTMTSAVTVTGLVVLDTSKDFTVFGQLVILTGIQVGGLGYSTMATLLLLSLGRSIGMRQRLMMMEVLSTLSMEGLVRYVKIIAVTTLVIEAAGAILLTARFAFDMDFGRALYFGIFHSISAFNNAGFTLFPENLLRYRGDVLINLTIPILVVLGAIGFLVFRDILDNLYGERFRFATHTKLVLLVTGLLILGGTVGIWGFEVQNDKTLGNLPLGEQILVAYFHSVSATAGFNTLDMSVMSQPALYLLILLMIVGGSPGSTAGGIKTTTLGILVASLWSTLKGRADVMMFHRRIPQEIVIKSFVLAALAWGLVTGFTMVLSYSERQEFLRILFEVASAAGTAGYSTGNGEVLSLSALFSDFGKLMIIGTMFIGRFGPLLLGLFAVRTHEELRYRYAEARVVLG